MAMSEQAMTTFLSSLVEAAGQDEDLLESSDVELDDPGHILGLSTRDFSNEGLLTSNKGFVVKLPDGSEFQVTVKKSR